MINHAYARVSIDLGKAKNVNTLQVRAHRIHWWSWWSAARNTRTTRKQNVEPPAAAVENAVENVYHR